MYQWDGVDTRERRDDIADTFCVFLVKFENKNDSLVSRVAVPPEPYRIDCPFRCQGIGFAEFFRSVENIMNR
ncbi:hypothetical protein DRO03_10220 [Methanosarcinales archaeon]|nr:MAG: hypothetical protein DRO03_10220 [Methanosarcinales archaeon]